jgi:hypothetical protein
MKQWISLFLLVTGVRASCSTIAAPVSTGNSDDHLRPIRWRYRGALPATAKCPEQKEDEQRQGRERAPCHVTSLWLRGWP